MIGISVGTTGQEVLLDHPEEMRAFIQDISSYARRLKPNFAITVLNAQNLLIKNPEEEEENRRAPARTFMKSIDAMVVEGLFFGERRVDQPRNKERLDFLLKQIDIAKRVFSPSPESVAHARRVVEAMGDGTGAIMLDGKMEDDASCKQCQVVLSLARELADRDPELAEAYGF